MDNLDMLQKVRSVILCLEAHPENEPDSEVEDQISDLEKIEQHLDTLVQDSPDGAELIKRERQRQIEKEGWTPEHDDNHKRSQLAIAAMCYASPSKLRPFLAPTKQFSSMGWDSGWWKPGERTRELSKAGALIAAEIDRIKRLETNK